MFQACFSYDKKGPCHILKPETAVERKKADQELKDLNKELKSIFKEEWELITRMN